MLSLLTYTRVKYFLRYKSFKIFENICIHGCLRKKKLITSHASVNITKKTFTVIPYLFNLAKEIFCTTAVHVKGYLLLQDNDTLFM